MSRTTTGRQAARAGFTLIELLVVITILGILATVVTFGVVREIDKAKVQKAKTQISVFMLALQRYASEVGEYPTSEEGLKVLIEKPADERRARGWKGPYLFNTDVVPPDPWKNDYIYQTTDTGDPPFEIISLGKDGAQGGEGNNADISSKRLGD